MLAYKVQLNFISSYFTLYFHEPHSPPYARINNFQNQHITFKSNFSILHLQRVSLTENGDRINRFTFISIESNQ